MSGHQHLCLLGLGNLIHFGLGHVTSKLTFYLKDLCYLPVGIVCVFVLDFQVSETR